MQGFSIKEARELTMLELPVLIETGSGRAGNAINASKSGLFEEVHSMELSSILFEENKERITDSDIFDVLENSSDCFAVKTKISHKKQPTLLKMHLGDSRTLLSAISARYQKEIVFYLDAHYCSGGEYTGKTANDEFPLWDELEIITSRPFDDLIIVDDVHTFGAERKDAPFWKHVCFDTILDAIGRESVLYSKQNSDEFVIAQRNRESAESQLWKIFLVLTEAGAASVLRHGSIRRYGSLRGWGLIR